jgi:hypothetical protein
MELIGTIMKKQIIRPTYPKELSIGLLLLIFAMAFFLSGQIFPESVKETGEPSPAYLGMFLISCAVIVMVLVMWEEFLFPIRIKPTDAGAVFRNHRNKLKVQMVIYSAIPLIFALIYFLFDVNLVRFFLWAAICIGVPLAGKLISGVRNYNDFLKLTNEVIEYKNNEKVGTFQVEEVENVTLVRDAHGTLHRILVSVNSQEVVIDIDEMELEAYYATIDEFIRIHYGDLVKISRPGTGK